MSETKRVRADELKPGDVCKDGTVQSVKEIDSSLVRITFYNGIIKNIAGDWTVDVIATDPRDALIARLRSEIVALHKVVIDAMAAASEAPGRTEAYEAVMTILDSAPEPSDETLAAIEAGGE